MRVEDDRHETVKPKKLERAGQFFTPSTPHWLPRKMSLLRVGGKKIVTFSPG